MSTKGVLSVIACSSPRLARPKPWRRRVSPKTRAAESARLNQSAPPPGSKSCRRYLLIPWSVRRERKKVSLGDSNRLLLKIHASAAKKPACHANDYPRLLDQSIPKLVRLIGALPRHHRALATAARALTPCRSSRPVWMRGKSPSVHRIMFYAKES